MAPRKNYTNEQIEMAIKAVRNGEKTAVAAQRFGVPRITLHDKVTGKTQMGCTMGPSTILTRKEEDILVKWIIALSKRHIPLTKDNLLDSVQKIVMVQNRPNPFTNNRPSKKWFQSFLKRHPELTQRVPDNLTRARDDVTEEDIKNWFQEIEDYLEKSNLKDILNDPDRLFNTDESAFFLAPKPGRILAKKGDKHLYSACGDEKDNLTVLITGNAAGQLAPPIIIYNYERIPSSIAAGIPDEWAVGKSESGWMCSSTFYEYITNVFNPWLEDNNIKKPILFFLDGHKSHLTLHLSEFCSKNGIEVIALYPNSTHLLQPMDLSVFRPLKEYWKKSVHEWKLENLGQNLRRENFAPVLQKAVAKLTPGSIRNGFRAGGLFSFGPEYIDFSKIKQKEAFESNTVTDPAQKEFLKYLEKEIINEFTETKIQEFTKTLYQNKNTLEQKDIALYTIWAKNKKLDNLSPLNAAPVHDTICTQEEINRESRTPSPDIVFGLRTDESRYSNKTGIKNPSRDANSTDIISTITTEPIPDVQEDDSVKVLSPNIFNIGTEITSDVTNPTEVIEIVPSPSTIEAQAELSPNLHNSDIASTRRDPISTVVNKTVSFTSISGVQDTASEKVIISNMLTKDYNKITEDRTLESSNTEEHRNIHLSNIEAKEKFQECSPASTTRKDQHTVINYGVPFDVVSSNVVLPDAVPFLHSCLNSSKQSDITQNSISTERDLRTISSNYNTNSNEVTPHKKTMEAVLGVTVPSPFKKSLFWPENDINKKKRHKREKIPSTVTNKAWKEYHIKKEMEKKKKEEEKEERKRIKLEKKILKEQIAENKKKQPKTKLKRKFKRNQHLKTQIWKYHMQKVKLV